MTLDPEMAGLQVQKLINLTEQLNGRLRSELELIHSNKAADIAHGMTQTAELANEYRRESARVKASPGLISNAPMELKKALVTATEAFDETLATHSEAVEAARRISEGLVRTIASEVAGARAMGTGYGASGHAAAGDGRAVALDRKA